MYLNWSLEIFNDVMKPDVTDILMDVMLEEIFSL